MRVAVSHCAVVSGQVGSRASYVLRCVAGCTECGTLIVEHGSNVRVAAGLRCRARHHSAGARRVCVAELGSAQRAC